MAVEQALNPGNEINALQSFSDATAGRSQQLFYACAAKGAAATEYILTRDGGISYPAFLSDGGAGTLQEINFDITVNKTTVFSGIAAVDGKINVTGPAGAGYFAARLLHVRSAVETEIAAQVTSATLASGDLSSKLKLSVSKKHFRPGDVLRLEMQFRDANSSGIKLYFDPNTTGDELKLWMPVVVLE